MSIFLTASFHLHFYTDQFCLRAPGNQLPLHPNVTPLRSWRELKGKLGDSPAGEARHLLIGRVGVLASGPHGLIHKEKGMVNRGDEEMLLVPGGWGGEDFPAELCLLLLPNINTELWPPGTQGILFTGLFLSNQSWVMLENHATLHSNRSKDWLHALPEVTFLAPDHLLLLSALDLSQRRCSIFHSPL